MNLEKKYELAMMGHLNTLNALYTAQAELAEARGIIAALQQEKINNGGQGSDSNGNIQPTGGNDERDGDGKAKAAG